MIQDGRTLPDAVRLETDVCIIGGGPAGLAVALRLARKPQLRVLVLESGGLEFDEPTQNLATGEVVGLPYYPLHETRIRALGGSSMSWGGICTPLDDLAFVNRPWVPESGWSFEPGALNGYQDDALMFCQVHSEFKNRTDALNAEIAVRCGINRERAVVTPIYFTSPTRFGTIYRKQLASSQNVTVVLHATITQLEVDQESPQIRGALARCLSGTGFRIAANRYVLAGGGIENARILLSSNQVRPCGIGNEHDVVGRYFMEHLRLRNRFRIRPGRTPLGRLVRDGVAGTLRFVRMSLSPVVQQSEQLLNFHANLQFGYPCQTTPQWDAVRRLLVATLPPWNSSPYYQDAGGGRSTIRGQDLLTILRRPDRAVGSLLGSVSKLASMRRFLQVYSAIEQVPSFTNRIRLSDKRDALGVPRVTVEWGTASSEERTYRRGLEILLDELEKLEPGIRSSAMDDIDPWPSGIVGNWHHIGTTRMHKDPKRGAVDEHCRVHGITNLFVAGSSVFPVSGSTSPTLTIVQLALRLADQIARQLI